MQRLRFIAIKTAVTRMMSYLILTVRIKKITWERLEALVRQKASVYVTSATLERQTG